MRGIALLAGLLLAGAASAAPADRADVGQIMQQLGMGALGTDSAAGLIANFPALQTQDVAGKACATKQVSALLDVQFQQGVVDSMGTEGSQLIKEWKQFLATESGSDMARTFQVTAVAIASGDAEFDAGLDEDRKAEISRFMATPAFLRFIDGFGSENQLPEDIGQQLVDVLQRECNIALNPEQIS
ncbi:MAG: hypothetical protein ACREP4_16040 [Stenotrophomonas sp.]|uniref:hypothetical protein n=1 Tax=Stenotrophomonas sp. TaxID=69392 RepID=UPI003D6CA860